MFEMEKLMHPTWLDRLRVCVFCGGHVSVRYNPANPLVASFKCDVYGASGVVGPPYDAVPVTEVTVHLDLLDEELED